MLRVKWTIPLSTVLPHHLKHRVSVFLVAATSWVVGISAADQQGVVRLVGKNSDIVIAVVLRFAFDQAEFCVTMARIPCDPLLLIISMTVYADIVDHVPGPNQEGAPVLPQQLKVIRMCLVAKEGFHII